MVATVASVPLSDCGSARPMRESAEAAVLAVDDARLRSRAAGDTSVLSRIYADDYQLITAEGVVRTKKDQIDEVSSGVLRFLPVELLDRTVHVYERTALVLSHERAHIIRNGQEIGGELRMTRVYVLRDERWQLVLAQATRLSQ